MTFTFLDVIFIVIVLFIAIHGAVSGFIKEFFGKAAIIAGILVAVLFFDNLSVFLVDILKSSFASEIVSFLLIFILVYLVVKIIQHFVDNFFENDIMGGLDHAMGFFLGAIEGLLVVSVVLIIFYAQPWFDLSSLLRGSFFNAILGDFLSTPSQKVQGMLAFSKGLGVHV